MSRTPVIGITTYGRNDEGRFTLPGEYVDCVRRAAGLALLLPPGEPAPDAWLDLVDGVVLAGGGDISPECWGGSGGATIYGVSEERDRTELALAERVLARRLPSLWICRGLQVLNVLRGGTLIEHLPDVAAPRTDTDTACVEHRLPPREPVLHGVRVDAGTRLAQTLGTTDVEGVSWHHQAIERCGEGVLVVARAPDGVIEAVELEGHPELEAVQWHPELSAASDPVQQRLFDALLARAAHP